MKKLISLALSLILVLASFGICAFAEEAPTSADVYVTISDKGTLKMPYQKITVTDIDDDAKLTINDALYCAHNAKYTGGAEAGYAFGSTQWGLSITKLWGDTSGNYGYWVNNASASSLTDTVKDGDSITAFVYTDGEGFSDAYSYFDVNTATKNVGDTLALTLTYASGYDENWNVQFSPLSDATITINGEATSYKTDAEGKATVTLTKTGSAVISAASDANILVPPVCVVTVAGVTETEAETTPETTEATETAAAETTAESETAEEESGSGCTGVITCSGIVALAVTGISAVCLKKRNDEK